MVMDLPTPRSGFQTIVSPSRGVPSGDTTNNANELAPFALAPSIFLPFKGFTPGDAPLLDQTQKLQAILQNLPEQQALVRGNMMAMVEQRVETLRARAREELDALDHDYEDDPGVPDERKRARLELDAMFQKTKMPPKKDAKSEDFELKPGELLSGSGNGVVASEPANGGVAMGGTEMPPRPRTARVIWEGLSRELQVVVDRAAWEMEAYDKHAQETMEWYRQALERRTGRHVPTPVATGMTGGILRNRNEESPIDRDAFRRMSATSIAGAPTTYPARAYEKMDEIARRGSTSK